MDLSTLIIEACTEKNFELVKKYIAEFELDDRELKQKEFTTLSDNMGLIAFGRLREYSGFVEMCSMGVVMHRRAQGFGKLMSEILIQRASKTIFLVCIIPSYFEPMGFTRCDVYPEEIQNKYNYCNDSLHVEEPYVVMQKTI